MPSSEKGTWSIAVSLITAAALLLSVCSALCPVWAEQAGPKQAVDRSREFCRSSGSSRTPYQCPRCCAKNVSGNECAKCGHPLIVRDRAFPYDRLPYRNYETPMYDLKKTERSIDRSMRSVDEKVRNMRSTIDRIRTIDRQIRAFRRR